jgi:hypothetical protein
MEQHLATCPACRKRMDRYGKISAIISSNIPAFPAEKLEASFAKLQARRAQVIAAHRIEKPAASAIEWTRSSVRFSVPAFAAVLAAAVFLPTLIVLATVARIQPQNSQYVAILPAVQNGTVDIDSSVKALATSNQVYSPDLPASVKGILSQKQLFKMINYARQFSSDKELFSNSDVIVLKLPELTRFSNTSDALISPVGTLQTNAGFMR